MSGGVCFCDAGYTGSDCATPPVNQPVDCVVGAWSAYGACSATCGGGTRVRTRPVLTPAAYGGAACPALVESEACNTQPCAVDCVVSDWSTWSTCSATCGGGTQTRTRTVLTPPSNGGLACPADFTETQACNTQACPTYTWSAGAYSACSVTCGGGTRSRPVVCLDSNTNIVADGYCDAGTKPAVAQTCNTQPCPASNE